MMSKNIKDYVKLYSFLDVNFCKNIIEKLKKENWETHSYYDYRFNSKKSYNSDFLVSNMHNKFVKELSEKLWFIIEKYILHDLKMDWFNGWKGYTAIRFNKYNKKTEMREHCDHIQSMFDGKLKGIPTLSIVGCLNDDYKGGDFIMWGTEKITIPKGSVIVFPSNFMYPHKVSPIKKGVRYSYVSWVY